MSDTTVSWRTNIIKITIFHGCFTWLALRMVRKNVNKFICDLIELEKNKQY